MRTSVATTIRRLAEAMSAPRLPQPVLGHAKGNWAMNEPSNGNPIFVWQITYQPEVGGLKIEGPAIPTLLLDVLGKCVIAMAQHVVPKEQPRVIVPTTGALSFPKKGRLR